MIDELKPHPEDFCEECGLINVIWSAPNKLWNKIARRPDGTDPMLCPTCFIKLVEKDAAADVQNAIDAALTELAEYLDRHETTIVQQYLNEEETMKQEDLNDLLSYHPSPEAAMQAEERILDAKERGCRCADRPGGHDSECFWSDHALRSNA